MKFKVILTTLFLFVNTVLFSQQNYRIKGSVVNSDNSRIDEAEIYILSGIDSAVVKYGVVMEGSFDFVSLPKGDYIIQVVSLGYQDLFYSITLEKDEFFSFIMETDLNNELNEIIVKARKKVITTKDGTIKINVKESIFEFSSSSLDLLQKLPGVLVSLDKEEVSILGRGSALIYIDKQKATVNDFNALTVADIESIEIIKNPSSKYEADGRAVLLITRVKSYHDSFEMTVQETASLKKGFNNYLGMNPTYKVGSLEFRGNINFNYLNPWEGLGNSFDIPSKKWSSVFDVESLTKRRQTTFGTAVFYALNDNDYLSFNINGRLQKDYSKNTANTHTLSENILEDVVTVNNNDEDRDFINSSLNYNRELKAIKTNVYTGFQFSKFKQTAESIINNNFNDTEYLLTQSRYQNFDVEVFTGRVDFEKKFIEQLNFEAGILYLSADATTDVDITDFVSEENTASLYLFKENNAAVYTQAFGKINKFSFLVGIRAENTNIKGHFQGEEKSIIDKNYTNFFPKAQLSISLDSLKSISFNYAKSISRPNYSSTSQISIYTNPYVVFSRNLNLNPSITDEVSFGFQLKDKVLNFNFFRIKNPTYFGYIHDLSSDIISFTSMNYELEKGFNIELTVPFSYKSYNSINTLSVMYNNIKDPKATVNKAKPYLYYYSNHSFNFSSSYSIMVTAMGFTERNAGAFKKNSIFSMNLSTTKTFMDKLDVSLSLNDVFGGLKFKENITVNDIHSEAVFYSDGREVALTLRYTFGGVKNSKFKEKNVNENSSRIN